MLPFADVVTPLPAGLTLSGTTLTWNVPILAVDGTASVSFSVTVHGDAHGVTIHNLATPTTPGGSCEAVPPPPELLRAARAAAPLALADPDVCATNHDTPPTWSLAKSANPPSGSTVDPGSVITYTLTARNTSQAPMIGAVAKDDLAEVLPFADLAAPLPAGLTRSGTTLTWVVPTIPVAGSVSVSFRVTVHQDASNVTVRNLATVASPNGQCTSCVTHHNVVPKPVPPPPAPPTAPSAMATTGVPVAPYLGWATLLILLGTLLLVTSRRRRDSTE